MSEDAFVSVEGCETAEPVGELAGHEDSLSQCYSYFMLELLAVLQDLTVTAQKATIEGRGRDRKGMYARKAVFLLGTISVIVF